MNYIESTLNNGYLDTWLLAGPRAAEISDAELERFGTGPDYKLQIMRHYHQEQPGIGEQPVERASFMVDGQQLRWQYTRCAADHFVNLSQFYHICHHLRAWAYAELLSHEVRTATLVLTTNAPADVWLNGEHVHRQEHLQHQIPQGVPFAVQLRAGANQVLVRFEAVGVRECPYVLSLRVLEPELAALSVRLPTSCEHPERYAAFERVFAQAYLEREVYGRNDELLVRWPAAMSESASIAVRLQTPEGRIVGEALLNAQAGTVQTMGKGAQFNNGTYQIVLLPHPDVFYQMNVRVQRVLPFTVLKNDYSAQPYGSYAQRRQEALLDATTHAGVFAEIAKMELGHWQALDLPALDEAIAGINRRRDCSDFFLVGLLGAYIRYGDNVLFPATLRAALQVCILNFRYWMDEPGEDAMCFWSENHQILFHTCAVLAGQILPEQQFSNANQPGSWHRAKGEGMARSWLLKRAAGGFREWDSNVYFEHDILALAHLADLAEDDALRELAAVILDKLCFTLALNSFGGVFGSTHGRSYTPNLLGARQEGTAGVGRLLWGQGVFNNKILGTVALACARSYELPPVISEVATARVEELWSRERHAGRMELWCDLTEGDWQVNKVTYKTPDYMLCSAQDYQPGERGYQQHIWQATLDHDAVVFSTQPPCVNGENSHRPNFWHGNVVLPRVAQWHGSLVAIYHRPPEAELPVGAYDGLDFTHAYFPTGAFDEYTLRAGWAFARKGQGYLALAAAGGLELVARGEGAYRELRSAGRSNIWLCHMGRAATDGDFAAFVERVLALPTAFEGLLLRCTTLRGEALSFGWQGPLLVDGVEQPLSGYKHYDSPLCTCELGATKMEIAGWNDLLRLDFADG